MQDLTKLAELANALTDSDKEKAVALVERMGEVIEGFGDKPMEWRPGILKLVQGTSDRGKLPKGAGIGSFVLGEDVLPTPYGVIPLRMWTSRQYWNPDPEQAQMLCSSPDGLAGFQYGTCKECPYSKFDVENNKSQCNKTLSVLCLSRSLDNLFVVNFSKTNYMGGVDWQGVMKKAGVAPYKRVYTLASQTSTKSKNVELIKAEPLTSGNRVEGPLLEFVEELFRISGEDRKTVLLKFHEYVNIKKAAAGAAIAPPEDVLLITAEETGNTGVVTDVEVKEVSSPNEAPSATSGKGKAAKYSF
jgi:hypothetical protein